MTARSLLQFKIRLLTTGLRLTARAARTLSGIKPPIRTRSGVSGGLDLVLPGHVHVNCSTTESFVSSTPFTLDFVDGEFQVFDGADGQIGVAVYPRPAYYDDCASDGTPYISIGQMCSGDRICIGMTRHCVYRKQEDRCQFCSIGHNIPAEAARKTPETIAETVAAAVRDPILPARHVLIGGGTPNHQDRGAAFAASACRAIKKHLAVSVYVMIVPPSELVDIDRLRDAGADELGMNRALEFFSEAAMLRYAPGKLRHVGIARYYHALERAVKVFGPSSTRSIVIVGLEPPEETIAGTERLAAMGVMPILSPFRPLDGSELASAFGFSPGLQLQIYEEVAARCRRYGIVPGPTCIPCQNNTLALPEDGRYYGEPWPGVTTTSMPTLRASL